MQATSRSHKNQENANIRNIGWGEATHRSIRGLNLAVVELITVQVTELPL